MYELLVGECQTVRNNGVSVERGSTVFHFEGVNVPLAIVCGSSTPLVPAEKSSFLALSMRTWSLETQLAFGVLGGYVSVGS